MKIRKKITLWITGTALLSTIAFSSFVFWEQMEQPFTLIDREIRHMANALIRQMTAAQDLTGPYDLSAMPYDPDAYWIQVKDDRGQILYASGLTRYTDLSIPEDRPSYMVEKNIPRSRIWLSQDDKDDVLFRVMVIRSQVGTRPIVIRIAKPIEGLEEELIELAVDIGLSLLVCVLLISALSYVLAGRILRPVSAIIRKSREIRETSLDQRIPLPGSRDELHELSVSLNKMFDRLQNSFEQQQEFIRNASHELKSPITLLMLAQEDLLMNEDLSSSSADSLMRQLETTRRMSHLVKNLLDLSRMQQQENLTRGVVDLTEVLAKVLDDYVDVLTARQISVRNDLKTPLPIHGDHEKLFRLFVNLIDNAIRYNLAEGGCISIGAEKLKSEILIDICNTGQKIPKSDLPKLFEQFHRVEKSRSQSLGGSGLGLAIARKIVSLHQGQITITNGSHGTIKVSVRLPLV